MVIMMIIEKYSTTNINSRHCTLIINNNNLFIIDFLKSVCFGSEYKLQKKLKLCCFFFLQPFQGFGFGDGGFHMSFGIGAFPFGFFASTFNLGDGRVGHPRKYSLAWDTSFPCIPSVKKKHGMLEFRYFDIKKYSIFWYHQIKHCILKRMIPRSFDLVR